MQYKAPEPMGLEELKVFLRKHNLKATPQRLAVHGAMLALGHACADMVAEEIHNSSETKVTVASVYNILTNLAEIGVYKHRLSSNNKMYFDVNNFNHIHLYDTVNNTYKDVLDPELIEMVRSKLRRRKWKGYRVDDIDIQILCHPSRTYKKSAEK